MLLTLGRFDEPARGFTPRASTGYIRCFCAAFHDQDRAVAEALMADDFVFTGPQDDHIDKATWLERCLPAADHFDGPSVTLQIVEVGGDWAQPPPGASNPSRRMRNSSDDTLTAPA
jgi:hypothetical protein